MSPKFFIVTSVADESSLLLHSKFLYINHASGTCVEGAGSGEGGALEL